MNTKVIAIVAAIAIVIAVAAAAILLMNGGSDDKKDEPVPSTSFSITDADGKTYTFDKPLDKVVCGYSTSGGPLMTMAAIFGDDLPNHLVGVDNSIYKYRTDIYDAFCNQVPGFKNLPQVGGIGADWDTKYVITLKPQALITSIHHKSTVQANNVDADLAKVGIPTIYINYVDEDVDKATSSINMLGKLFGKEARAKEVADYYADRVNSVVSSVSKLIEDGKITRKTVYNEPLQFGASQYGKSCGDNYLQGKVIYMCGGKSICPVDSQALNDTAVLAADPEVIFFLGSDWKNGNDYLNLGFNGTESEAKRVIDTVFTDRPGYDGLSAYKNGEVYSLAMTISREVWDFSSFSYIATCLNPDVCKFDANQEMKSFFDRFMPVKYNGLWFFNYSDNSEPVSSEIKITDADGKTYTFDEPLDKVVLGYSGSGGPFTTLAALLGSDLPDYLVGIDNSLYKFRDDIYSAFCNEVPGFKDLPQVGGIGSDWDTKKIITLQPQAFITSIHHKSTVQANNVDADLAKVGIPTIYISYIDEDIEKARQSITNLGKLFGKEARAEEIADYYAEKVGAVTSKVQSLLSSGEITRKDVYIEPIQYGWSKNGTSRGNDTEQGKIVYLCGGNSISPNGNNTLDDITILASDPDAILFLGTKWASDADFLKLGFEGSESEAQRVIQSVFDNRKGYNQLGAYKSGEVYSVGFVLSRDVWDFAAFEYVSSSLFPDKMSFDYEGDLKTFYDKFMPVKYSGLWFYDYKS